ncbi:hypothetical protein [Pectobacterium odoriferum]|uniref:hypothetical protein n=1 Tax=Pectobacterium odoriferum TaxID=78398 RepID=UPI0005043AE9|nr:hypothetical protein [Pectobacterium odoriferum]KGA31123.1 hypothetical protein KS43_19445 [Pectobacterium odoriferum]
MARLTKEQREAKKLATATAVQNAAEQEQEQEQEQELIVMVTDHPDFPGAPTEAQVHADEVENWKLHGWKVKR